MNKQVIVSALLAIGFLAGCNNNLTPLSATNDRSSQEAASTAPAVNNSEAQKMLHNIEAALKEHSVDNNVAAKITNQKLPSGLMLDSSQISMILGMAGSALNGAGLGNSNDLSAIIPVLIGGATQGAGNIGLPSSQLSDLLGVIGNGSLSSILNSASGTGSGLPTGLIQTLTGSLFQNLPLAGVTSGNISQVAGSLMSSLTGNLGNTGLGGADLSSIIQSISSGATLGIGKSGFNSSLLNSILGQIGMGSVTGISGINLPGGMNTSMLQTLLSAFTSGSNFGLGQLAGSQVINNSMISTLLGSLTQGQSAALPSTGMNSSQQQMMMMFMQMLLANLGKR
ncbi:hypothetical protein [Bdellovibrio bacteriovorus]|uniref:hypothetical protein n=1 Tax=Bdellovibrio bacteriovorus TaxID=959 RepID=UPI0035A64C48